MAIALFQPVSSKVKTGGTAVIVAYPGNQGGFIVNPLSAQDQILALAEPLFIDPTGPASPFETSTTIALYPGSIYYLPANSDSIVWANAQSSGHSFSAVIFNTPLQTQPTVIESDFPPLTPSTQTSVIPSYSYQEYNDDDSVNSFILAYNTLAQNFLDTLNSLNLPIYTSPTISGPLLDWVAQGMYGMQRPSLASGLINVDGSLNTYQFNTLAFNTTANETNVTYTVTNDDIFKRILTWHFYKGDGKVFNIRWLKRRIMRFINGVNGTAPNVDNTSQVSVTLGINYQVTISLVSRFNTLIDISTMNTFAFNMLAYNQSDYSTVNIKPLDSTQLIEAIRTGALELPFQFTWTVTAG